MSGRKTGFMWVYGLITLFAVGIIELVIIPAIEFQVVPKLTDTANLTLNSSNYAAYVNSTTTIVNFMHYSLYVVMFVVFIYLVLSVFLREENEVYQP